MKTDSASNQLRWVILLLSAAVILPTVCLLWFMNQTVKNERIAVRTKLVDVYKKQYEISRETYLNDKYVQLNTSLPLAEGILVYDSNGIMTFPVLNDIPLFDNDIFVWATILEYQEKKYEAAMNEYQRIAELSDKDIVLIQAQISHARCLSKLNRQEEAIAKIQTVLSKDTKNNISLRAQKCHALLLLLELTEKSRGEEFKTALMQTYDFLTHGMETDDNLQFLGESDYLQTAIPSARQAFTLQKFTEYAGKGSPDWELDKKIKRATKLASIIAVSLEVACDYPEPTFAVPLTVTNSTVFRLKTEKALYGRFRRARGHVRLRVFNREHLTAIIDPFLKDIEAFPSACRIYDETGEWTTGKTVPPEQRPFIEMPVSQCLPGWTAQLYIKDATFENAANKQAFLYTWTGFLVIGFILLCSGFATTAIIKQQKMNRLKNDFIATVTHELKTPLSSMRLLVDTLLEKRYDNEATATEYLQMVANENKRLTHLIDSFLTFSRMERNKQVFDFQSVSPAEITTAAVEAMQAKLSANNCHFECTIAENLPPVNGDKDAMVTVIVNLLDNAYKYTNTNKEIQLNVYVQNKEVCFAVKDNGIGLTNRAQKKIFNRFYQVDSRLSRRSEGCGLGLSIVQFILNAHKGRIDVESLPNKGSLFIVKLPAL